MPQGATVTLYVKPYIYRYVVAKLADPERMARDHTALAMRAELERVLHRLVEGVEHVDTFDRQGSREPKTRLVLRLSRPWEVRKRSERVGRDTINSYLEGVFLEEMIVWVNFYRRSMNVRSVVAVRLFFAHYDLREQDYLADTAKRVYNLYRSGRRTTHTRRRRKGPTVNVPTSPRAGL